MASNQVLVVSVRLFAIWIVAFYLVDFRYLMSLKEGQQGQAYVIFLLTFAIVLLLVVALWRFAPQIAHRLLAGTAQPIMPSATGAGLDGWFAVGCAFIGLLLIAWSYPSLMAQLVIYFMTPDFPYSRRVTGEMLRFKWLPAIYPLSQLVLGAALFAGAGSLSRHAIKRA